MPRQWQDVGPPLSQRRQAHGGHTQAVVQIGTEMLRLDGARQVDVGGRHQAHIERNAAPRSQANHLALLQHPQQLDLQGHGQITDLIKEQGAAMGRLEPARTRLRRPREGARLMPEQFGIDQGFAEGTAVDGHERPGASTGGMDVPCDQLLARAGFTGDQGRGFTAGDAFHMQQQGLGAWIVEDQRLGTDGQRRGRGFRQGQHSVQGGAFRGLWGRCSGKDETLRQLSAIRNCVF